MTYVEYMDALRRGAIGLWDIGVVEEHGPHLPLGTDIYLAHAQTLEIREQLAERGIESLILPPFVGSERCDTQHARFDRGTPSDDDRRHRRHPRQPQQ